MSILRISRMAFALYLVFVVYGSLVPLDFRSIPLAEALTRFQQLPYLDLGIDSRADWVANLLLFIPLTFLAMAALAPQRRAHRATSVTAAIGVLLAAGLLSLGIEFVQLFFPPRTVSQNDVLAETLGAALGIVAWWRWGGPLTRWVDQWRDVRGPAGVAEKLLWTWLALLFAYNLLPLDLTISPVELYHKWQQGRINLIPLAASPRDWLRLAYELVTDILLWVPVSALWMLSGRATAGRAWRLTLGAALLLELLQLLVFSRYSDTTDLLTAAIGAWAGLRLARRLGSTDPGIPVPAAMPMALLIAGWLGVLAAVYWYPFDFRLQAGQLGERAALLLRVPFYTLYYGTELRAATELLHKVLTFAPLGVLAAWATRSWSGPPHRAKALILVALILPPLAIELGQLALPDKHPDSTDLLLEWLGGVLGYLGATFVAGRWRSSARRPAPTPPGQNPVPVPLDAGTPAPKPAPARWLYLAGQLALVITLALAAGSDAVPYNVRELMRALPVPLGAVAIAVALNLLFLGPALAGIWLIKAPRRRLWLVPVGLIAQAILLYLLMRVAVPRESLYDVVGAPVLRGIDELELLGRFVALAMFGFIALAGGSAAWCALRAARPGVYRRWLWFALPLIAICHWVIVSQAATDNLTELMRGGGSPVVTAMAALWLWLLAVAASLTTAAAAGRIGYVPPAVTAALSVPLGYLLLSLVTAPQIHKYGQSFSALQFLLSPDRQHLVHGDALIARYVILHLGLLLIMALVMYPLWARLGLRQPDWRPLRRAAS